MVACNTLIIDPGVTYTKGIIRPYDQSSDITPDIPRGSMFRVKSQTRMIRTMRCDVAPDVMFDLLGKIPLSDRRKTKVIGIPSHGATQVPIGDEKAVYGGAPSYDFEGFQEYHEKLLDLLGGSEAIYLETGSPEMDKGINALQQIYYLMKKHPQLFNKTRHFLPLSSYMAFLLTGERATCHTHTRNHAYIERIVQSNEGWAWSSAVSKLGIQDKFPRFKRPFDVYGVIKKEIAEKYGLPKDCIVVAVGHDTSAASILAPNYINTGSWICNTAVGVDVKLVSKMQKIGLAVNADVWERNLRTIMARLGTMRDKYLEQYKGRIPPDVAFESLNRVTEYLRLAFMEGIGVYPSEETAKLPDSLQGNVSELFHSLAFAVAVPEAMSSILTSDDTVSLDAKLSDLLNQGYKAKEVIIGGNFVNPLGEGQESTFTKIFPMVYPGNIKRLSFPEPTSYAAHVLAVCALEGIDPRDIMDRVQVPTEYITFTGDREQMLEKVIEFEKRQGL